MRSILSRLKMYLLSLSLLFAMIAVQVVDVSKPFNLSSYENLLGIGSIILSLVGILCYFDFVKSRKYIGNLPSKIQSIQSENFQAISFLATYIVPIAFIDFKQPRNALNAGILLVAIGAIFIKTNMYYTNPILSILGFHLYRAEINGSSKILISKSVLVAGDTIRTERLGDDVYFVRNKESQ